MRPKHPWTTTLMEGQLADEQRGCASVLKRSLQSGQAKKSELPKRPPKRTQPGLTDKPLVWTRWKSLWIQR